MPRLTLTRMEAENGGLPSLCMRCGAPADCMDRKNFAWHPQWVYLLIFVGLLPMLIVGLCLTKRMTVQGPFCPQHRNHWTFRRWMIGGGLFLVLALVVGALILTASEAFPNWIWLGVGAGGLAWLVVAVALQASSIEAREITDTYITLGRVAEQFIQAVEGRRSAARASWDQQYFHQAREGDPHVTTARGEYGQPLPGQQPYSLGEQNFRKPTSSMSGGLIAIIVLAVFGVVCVGCLGVITMVGQKANSTFVPVGTALSSTTALPVIDLANHFQLHAPGSGWILLDSDEARKNNKLAAAAAELPGKDIYCSVLIETATPDIEVEDREEEFADQMIKFGNNSLTNKRVEKITPLKFKGQKAVRYRYTGTNKDGLRMLIDVTAFVYEGKLYRLHCAGALSDIRVDGSTFQPFLDAFELLPGP